MRRRITEYLEIDVETERWHCQRCGHDIADARANYKTGLLIASRDPTEIHNPEIDGEYNFAPDPQWCRIVEFYCPGCAALVETEYLPPGHPLTYDIELDIDQLKLKTATEATS